MDKNSEICLLLNRFLEDRDNPRIDNNDAYEKLTKDLKRVK